MGLRNSLPTISTKSLSTVRTPATIYCGHVTILIPGCGGDITGVWRTSVAVCRESVSVRRFRYDRCHAWRDSSQLSDLKEPLVCDRTPTSQGSTISCCGSTTNTHHTHTHTHTQGYLSTYLPTC